MLCDAAHPHARAAVARHAAPAAAAAPRRRYQHEGVRESEWRFGHKLRPYIFDAIQLVDALPRALRAAAMTRARSCESARKRPRATAASRRPRPRTAPHPRALAATAFPRGEKPAGLEFVHFPIVDCSIAAESSVLQLAYDLVARLVRGEVMYVHCW